MQRTVDLHAEAFQEQVQYMNDVVAQYVVQLPESTTRWVPVDLIRHLYHGDKSFRFRLNRFLKGLTSTNYRVEDDDTVFELQVGNVGTTFLSWDMTLALFLQEGRDADKKKGKAKSKEVALVKESKGEEEEALSDVAEASMALILLQQGPNEDEEPHRDLEGDQIVEEIPELDVTTLHPIIMDDKEFLFLDDICKSLGLREDEALSILAISCGFHNEDTPEQQTTGVQIDFDDHSVTKALEFQGYDKERTIEETVSNALVAIQNVAAEYENVPQEAFQPHKRLHVDTSVQQSGSSIDICNPRTSQCDDDAEVRLNQSCKKLCLHIYQ